MYPDFERATAKAESIIKQHGIACPMTILKKTPGVLVASYAETSESLGIERQNLMEMFGEHNQDAFTTVKIEDNRTVYLVMYNRQLTCKETRYALARELGHIVLGHDGTRPESVRNEEAVCFANHLLEGTDV